MIVIPGPREAGPGIDFHHPWLWIPDLPLRGDPE